MSPVAKAADAPANDGREGASSRLRSALRDLAEAAGERVVSATTDRMGAATDRFARYAEGGGPGLAATAAGAKRLAEGSSPVKAGLSAGMAAAKERVKTALRRRGGNAKNKIKVTNIVETVDVGVPLRLAYDKWTRFEDFPQFMKKVEHVERTSDEESTWKAQIFWSHRSWQSTIVEQVPDQRIVWRATGAKGSVDGAVTFHEIAPELTRILLILEYHPQGLFERTGNLWRAQGRRVRLELKHFARHVMTETILRPAEVEGWRGEIRDGQVVRDSEPSEPSGSTRRTGDRRRSDGKGERARRTGGGQR
ncbi:SRPBCC family protein [Plantactinospora solaniradicis]|uniref:SRPBCC family protein n=1 Tax=Plantactinospora solaniradicis TaxID=1723736 RepID=A0ABW1KJ08_9ACTN